MKLFITYTHKNAQPVQGWWKQPWTMLRCPHCSMLSTILFSIVTPDCELIQAQQCWTILLTTLNNVGSTTLFKAVFINPEQVVCFLLCKPYHKTQITSCRFVQYNTLMKHTQIFACFIARSQIAQRWSHGGHISYEIWRAGHLKTWGGGFPGRPTCVSIDYGVSNDAKQQCPHN